MLYSGIFKRKREENGMNYKLVLKITHLLVYLTKSNKCHSLNQTPPKESIYQKHESILGE